ncbi:MAG: hypothetical protein J5621_05740 [Paludibacteraceae bacterium]|nr:hypothetical protein [Paludibacteraceae bacterium]
MKILIAPLNWGLGHASRCIPLIRQWLSEGHEVVLAGDGDSLILLRKHFPTLRYVYLAPLRLRYSAGRSQIWAMLKAIPRLIVWSVKDHLLLRAVLREESFDRVVSDNRFGLYTRETQCVYMTHQLLIRLPEKLRCFESLAARLHARIYARYNMVWVPDFEDKEKSLAGDLSHPFTFYLSSFNYLGPLSRFEVSRYQNVEVPHIYDTVVVLSGLEPQRTLLEKELIAHYSSRNESVLIVQGLVGRPNTRIKRGNITVVPHITDEELAPCLLHANHIIARSGYSTIMDLYALGVLDKAELIPTPGQPEQEYLAQWISTRESK